MHNGQRVLGVIPARGGSKSVPRKNIRLIEGQPLITFTIDQAKQSVTLDLLVVSTDDAEISAIAGMHGVRVIDRPAAIASDTASTESALLHALDVLEGSGEAFDYVVVLEPTSPLRSSETIDGCVRQAIESGAVSLLTVRETRENIGSVENGRFKPLVPGAPRRRQDRRPFFVESSTVYVCRVDYLRQTGSLVADDWAAYVVPTSEAEDINTMDDFRRVAFLLKTRMVNS